MKYLSTMLLMLTSTYAYSHPGHDHNHWTSDAVHSLLIAALIASVGLGVYLSRKYWKKPENK